jgi:PhzF family phenazine biosynthesis protein
MKQKLYQIDAFTDKIFQGNPAAVCPLKSWLSDDLLQKIAMENNLSETAFFVKEGNKFLIRWFTPTIEVDLCGHATLASAFVIFNLEGFTENIIHFKSSNSGELTVTRSGEKLTLNFPADVLKPVLMTREIIECFNIKPKAVFKGKTDYLLVYEKENEISGLTPRLENISRLECRGIIVTAPGEKTDFVSRFFGPQSGVDEDPVTGSAHTSLTPYWAERLGKQSLTALQLSERKGYLECKYLKERVEISGHCRLYLEGEIIIE